MNNIVLHANLGMRVKLEELAAAAPDRVTYTPGGFPGAQCEIPVKETCTCTRLIKCGCKATIVIFDSGSIIIAGVKTVADGNAVYARLIKVMSTFRDDGLIVAKEDRYKTRIERFKAYLSQNATVVDRTRLEKQKKQRQQRKLKKQKKDDDVDNDEDNEDIFAQVALNMDEEDEALQFAIQDATDVLRHRSSLNVVEEEDVTDLMRACDTGQFQNVQMLVENGLCDVWALDKHGKTALDRIRHSDENGNLVRYLEKTMKTK